MSLEANRVEVQLMELLYKTDYSDDFDREVRVLAATSCLLDPLDPGGGHVYSCTFRHMCTRCVHVGLCNCVCMHRYVQAPPLILAAGTPYRV
jgi:hypothetical protein